MGTGRSIVFDNAALVPDAWRFRAGQGPIWCFNPAILAEPGGWIFATRLVFGDQARRIAICRLDAEFHIVPGSLVPLSDLIRVPPAAEYAEIDRHWFADPRLYRWQERLFLYWNSGWHVPPNAQFMQELDPHTLHPLGAPRRLEREGASRPIEKNWTFFGDAPLWVLYSIDGQQILRGGGGASPFRFAPAFTTPWDAGAYTQEFGSLRGGAPPQRLGDGYYAFCHSMRPSPSGYRYVPAVYRFSDRPPFAATHAPARPLPLDNPFPKPLYRRLNPLVGETLYICGAAFDNGHWVLSHGVDDERAAIARLPRATVEACLRPL